MIYTETRGTGRPVVLLHGFAESHKYWDQVLTYMSKEDYKILTPDLLGFGRSSKPDDRDYDIDEHAQALVSSVLEKCNSPVILVGHSMGAMVATRIARFYPHLVSRLILINMPLFESSEQAIQVVSRSSPMLFRAYVHPLGRAIYATRNAKTIPRALHPRSSEIQGVVGGIQNHTRVSLLRSLHNTILGYQPVTDLRDVEVMTTLIYSHDDRYCTQNVLDIVKTMNNIQTVELSDGHQLPLRQAEAIAHVIYAAA